MAQGACPACGKPLAPGAQFCSGCGASVRFGRSSGPGLAQPVVAAAGTGNPKVDELLRRAKRQVLPLLMVAVISYLDYQLHGQAAGMLIVFAAGTALTLFLREGVAWAMRALNIGQLPSWASALFITVPIAIYYFARAKGTLSDGNGMFLSILIAGLPLAFNAVASTLDPSLQGYYELRNRTLPTKVRPLVLVGLSVFVTFGLVHGRLGDVMVLFGNEASKVSPPKMSSALMAVLLNALITFALLHNPRRENASQ